MAIELPEGMSDEMFWAMCDQNMGLPVPLAQADLSLPFVYERRWGVFYVPMGHHQLAMTLLLAWQYGHEDLHRIAEALNLRLSDETADHWLLTTPGAAFRSSVGKSIWVGSFKGMTVAERRAFAGAKTL